MTFRERELNEDEGRLNKIRKGIMTNGEVPGSGPEMVRGVEVMTQEERLYQMEVKIHSSPEIVKRILEFSRQTPEQLARETAQKGTAHLTVSFLELTDLPISEKCQILAESYENKSKKENSLAIESGSKIFHEQSRISDEISKALRGWKKAIPSGK